MTEAKEVTLPVKSRRVDVSFDYNPQTVLHRRSLRLAISCAVQAVLPSRTLIGGHSLAESHWFGFSDGPATQADVDAINSFIEKMVTDNCPIKHEMMRWEEVVDYLEHHRQPHAAKLCRTRVKENVEVAVVVTPAHKFVRLFHFDLLPHMGGLTALPYVLSVFEGGENGFLVSFSKEPIHEPALVKSFLSHKAWDVANGIQSLGDLNGLEEINRGRKDYVLHAEFRQENQIAEIVGMIKARKNDPERAVKCVAIAGPTSSGKTTFSHKLSMYLKDVGCEGVPLSVDHYYRPLNEQPKYKIRQRREDVDYDSLESMDVEQVNADLDNLMKGHEVMTPVYNMKTGYRDPPGHRMKLPRNGVLVIEGIHALNPEYTKMLDQSKLFKIYLSPLTAIQLDDFNVVKTTDHRLLRRMSRDYKFRGHSATRTLTMWAKVRAGEHKWVFPNQNYADYIANSAMEYELCVLKVLLEPLLRAVPARDEQYYKARELISLLDQVNSWPEVDVPPTSLLREFIGNGAFDCH